MKESLSPICLLGRGCLGFFTFLVKQGGEVLQ